VCRCGDCPGLTDVHHPARALPPTVNLRSVVLIGDVVGEEERGDDRSELLVLALEGERRRISSSVDSRVTLRSEYEGSSSNNSVNLEKVMVVMVVVVVVAAVVVVVLADGELAMGCFSRRVKPRGRTKDRSYKG